MRRFILIGLAGFLSACNLVPDEQPVESRVPNLVLAKAEPLSKTGNDPYVVEGVLYTPQNQLDDFRQTGLASWYGQQFHERKTSSGEVFDMYQHSAAHKTLPIPSYIKVTNLENNKSLTIRVNDRGPFVGDRILDLSYAAARDLGFVNQGTAEVLIESITKIRAEQSAGKTAEQVFLQAGVFGNHDNATRLQQRLEQQGYQVKIDQRDDSLYSVKVGPYSNAQLAYNEKIKLERTDISGVLLLTE